MSGRKKNHDKSPRCRCWLCKNDKNWRSIKSKCTPEEAEFLEELFSRMAHAQMDLAFALRKKEREDED